jgi:hypothetical protein
MKLLIQSFRRMAAHSLRGHRQTAHGPASVPPRGRSSDDVVNYSYGPDGMTGEYGSGEHSVPDLGRYGAPAKPGADDVGL